MNADTALPNRLIDERGIEWVLPPIHAMLGVGHSLPGIYFNPGTTTIRGVETGSLWAIAYHAGQSFRYERLGIGAVWTRVG